MNMVIGCDLGGTNLRAGIINTQTGTGNSSIINTYTRPRRA